MPRVYVLQRVQRLAIGLHEAWDFFVAPGNLSRLTPPELQLEFESPQPSTVYAGLMLQYRVRVLPGIRMRWLSEITHVEPPHRFVDEQRLGPYRLWHHEHVLGEIPGGTEVRDLIHYVLPLGGLLGRLMHRLLVRRQLERIFDYRAAALAELFGTLDNPVPANPA
jgi:ligand-binding SRPBCC domain-containing protein